MKNRKLLLVPLLALLLTGCQPTTSDSLGSNDPSSDVVSSEPKSEEPSSSENEKETFDNFYLLEDGVNYDNRALDVANGLTALNSRGDQKLLVVPVVFTNSTTHATPENHEMLEKLFFGASEETGWESVSSFYAKSSHGRLSLTGEVQDYFYLPYSTSEFLEFEVSKGQDFGNPDNYWDETHHIIRDIYEAYDAETLKAYDLDGDGHVDALWLVYMYPHDPNGEAPFWAYKFYWNQNADKEKPTPNTYAWASFDFAKEGKGYNYSTPDAHTFIHETGHMFGLNDYYDYDNLSAPTGKIDMMDNNIIDHNAYSKFLLNWVNPYVITGDAEITLRPAESSGDLVLIRDGWNGHAYDEYILLEYYTPTGVNEKDSDEDGYATSGTNSGIRGFYESGIRMWHVDSRLIRYRTNGYTWINKIEKETSISSTVIGPTNTTSSRRIIEEDYRLLHLMDAKGVTSKVGNWLKTPTLAGNSALFKEGKFIDASDWGKYIQNAAVSGVRPSTLNCGTEVGYSIEFGEMNELGAAIKIRKA